MERIFFLNCRQRVKPVERLCRVLLNLPILFYREICRGEIGGAFIAALAPDWSNERITTKS